MRLRRVKSFRFQSLFSLTLLVSVIGLYLTLMELTRSQPSLLTLLVREWSRETIKASACARGILYGSPLLILKREKRGSWRSSQLLKNEKGKCLVLTR